MNLLVTGAAGMLGSALVPAMAAAGHRVVPTDIDLSDPSVFGPTLPALTHLDVRDRDEVRFQVEHVSPDMILHLAAATSLEVCDADPDHAYLTNTIATKYVALQARSAGIPMVYISTAGVFDGVKDEAYTEFDRPNPINTYGSAKYEGELIVARTVESHFIIRAGWMVGGGQAKDHKFVSLIVNQVLDGATTIRAVTDKRGTPTYAPDFSRCLLGLLDSGLSGLYHMACGGDGTRYDVAAEILRVLGRTDITLEGVDSSVFADRYSSNRPASEIMRNFALDLQGMNTMRAWRVALEEYLHSQFPALETSLVS